MQSEKQMHIEALLECVWHNYCVPGATMRVQKGMCYELHNFAGSLHSSLPTRSSQPAGPCHNVLSQSRGYGAPD